MAAVKGACLGRARNVIAVGEISYGSAALVCLPASQGPITLAQPLGFTGLLWLLPRAN
jgi:hypothetical protein